MNSKGASIGLSITVHFPIKASFLFRKGCPLLFHPVPLVTSFFIKAPFQHFVGSGACVYDNSLPFSR